MLLLCAEKCLKTQAGTINPGLSSAGQPEDDKGHVMTILTGEFAIAYGSAEHRAEQPDGAAPSPAAVGDSAAGAEAATADAVLSEDARLYLSHVEQGVSIRALARQLGCHASTVLRRIRRFEQRRDDPLIDRALTSEAAVAPKATPQAAAADACQILRVLRRLAEPGAVLGTADTMDKAIVMRDELRTAVLDRRLAETMALRGWILRLPEAGRLQRYVITPGGRAALRQMLHSPRQRNAVPGPSDFAAADPVHADPVHAAAGAPADSQMQPGMAEAAAGFDHADRHRVWQDRVIEDPEDGRRVRSRVNLAESPLLMLARRRDQDGQMFLTPGMVSAGERLREDFELAQMGPRVTQNWDGFMTSGIDVSRMGGGYRGGSESARDRVAVALRDLGPGMGDIVLRVCCFLEGIELTERRLGWSARSGKIVLRLALMRLERHYHELYGSGAPLIG